MVAEGHAHPHRVPVGEAGGVHHAAHGLEMEVQADIAPHGSRLPKAVEGGVDHVRLDGTDLLVGQAHALHAAVLEIFAHHVGAGDKGLHSLLALGLGQVQADALFPPVQKGVVAAVFPSEGGPVPGQVARARPLDFDHLRPHVGQQHSGQTPGVGLSKVDDADAGKRFHCSSPFYMAGSPERPWGRSGLGAPAVFSV